TNRAATTCGRPGNATAVATTTTGLIAGEASRNASAAGGATPRAISPPATGTDAHSQPGSSAPAAPATGTAAYWLRGSARAKKAGGTNAAIAPEISTPSTRNGSACTHTATNTVAHVRTAGAVNRQGQPGRPDQHGDGRAGQPHGGADTRPPRRAPLLGAGLLEGCHRDSLTSGSDSGSGAGPGPSAGSGFGIAPPNRRSRSAYH